MGNKHDSKRRRKGDPVGFKKRRRYDKRSTTLSVEQVESTEDPISPIVSASHRKLTINNDDLLSKIDASAQPPVTPGSSSDSNKLSSFHYLLLGSSILETILSVVGACPICSCKELEFCNNISKKNGLANCLEIKCKAAGCNFFIQHLL